MSEINRREFIKGATAVIGGLCVVVLALLHKELVLLALDRTQAAAVGLPVRVLDAILYAVDKGARVLNNRWGVPDYSQALRDAVAVADSAGALLVAAAGNVYPTIGDDNDLVPLYPASLDLPRTPRARSNGNFSSAIFFISDSKRSRSSGVNGRSTSKS